MNEIPPDNGRGKSQPHAKLFEQDRDGAVQVAPLHDRIRVLPAGQEARFVTVLGNQVGLGQALEQPSRLKRPDDDAQVRAAVEGQQVQEIAKDESLAVGELLLVGPVEVRRRELLGCEPPDPVPDPSDVCEEGGAELLHGGPTHLGESDA